MNNNLVIHLSDLHIRLNSRYEEYDAVLQKIIKEIKKIKPVCIIITGDLFHIKIAMSPKSTSLAGWFLKELSLISPTFLIMGNHDMNEKMRAQGNTVEPLIELMNNGFVLHKKDTLEPIIPYKNGDYYGVYLFKDSGLYEYENIVFAAFSMWDNEIVQLNDKEPEKKYIALYHNPIFGCKLDSGLEYRRDDSMNISEFANYDVVMLGDIHKYQTFKRKNHFLENGKFTTKEIESAAFAGSAIQQHFGESIDKGFLVWNLDTFTHERVLVPNEFGFCKLYVKYGENLEERLSDLYFSANKEKTKIKIEYEIKEEDFSAEIERQIIMKIKKLHGCESVTLDAVFIKQDKSTGLIEETSESQMEEDFEPILIKWMEENNFDLKEDVVQLSRDIDKELGANDKKVKRMDWEINSLEINNLFSFPEESVIIDFDKMNGVTGIFGDNFSGKSNIVRALIWVLYGKILGDGENYEAINIYSKSNVAYGDLFITIDGVQYRIYREIKMTKSKKGEIKCAYDIKFQYLKNEDWVDAEKEIGATEKTQSKQLIEETIGDFDDFTKVCLQTQGGKFDYLGLSQQPKNDLINKYVGLEIFRYRYDLANNRFKEIKNVQKHLGDLESIKSQIVELEDSKKVLDLSFLEQEIEKKNNQLEFDNLNTEIIELSKKIIPIKDKINYTEEQINSQLLNVQSSIESNSKKTKELEEWLLVNSKKDVPVDNPSEYDKKTLERTIESKKISFEENKTNYNSFDAWIKENPKKEEIDTTQLELDLQKYRLAIQELENKKEISKGKNCPTCGNEQQKADPELEKNCVERIEKGNASIKNVLAKINDNKNNIKHNISYDKNINAIDSLKNVLIKLKQEIKESKDKLELSDKVSEILSFNLIVDKKNSELKSVYSAVISNEKLLNELNNKKQTLIDNKSAIENNIVLEDEIKNLKEIQKNYKLAVYNLDNSIRDISGKIMINITSLNSLTEKIESIKKAENDYKKYSIYLQAVHRDGIPSQIIRRKIPIINSKINNIISKIANFKVELSIKENGDIKEYFYYNDDKSDKLSLSMGSGSQKFIATVAVRDALHFISSLTKPSFCAIDEGWDSLDSSKKQSVVEVLDYLKTKYKNVFVITHLQEIKDVVENEICVNRKEYQENEELKWFTELGIN